jgi:hypothetical protein
MRARLPVRDLVAHLVYQVRFGVLLIALVAYPHRVCAQDQRATLIGSLRDEKDGRPIRSAKIQIIGQGIDIPADDSGRFVHHELPSGPTTLRVHALGYAQRDTTVVLQAGVTVEWRAVLSPRPVRLDEQVCITYRGGSYRGGPAIVVEISDSVTGAPLAEQAYGVVRDRDYVDSLRPYRFAKERIMTAARKRAGTYDVTVEHAGYAPWTKKGVKVSGGECYAITVELKARLQKLP